MRDYSKVSPVLWQSQRFNSLPSDEGRYLYLYLLTNEHQNSAGCYRLRDGTACDDLQWPKDRFCRARAELVDADLIQFDPEFSVVRVMRWFKHNPPMNAKHLTGIERVLERLPSQTIAESALEALQASWESIQQTQATKTAQRQKAAYGPSSDLSRQLQEKLRA
jgi:hypothetical protein